MEHKATLNELARKWTCLNCKHHVNTISYIYDDVDTGAHDHDYCLAWGSLIPAWHWQEKECHKRDCDDTPCSDCDNNESDIDNRIAYCWCFEEKEENKNG